jgi:hypothetical protein
MMGGKSPRWLGMSAAAFAIATAITAPARAYEAAEPRQAAPLSSEEILVIGQRVFVGVQPERDLDEDAISSYGANTIDDLLTDLQNEVGGDEEPPLILVNGERVGGLDDIGGLPVETLQNVKVLPRGTAVKAGGKSGQRVVAITLKKQTRSATALLAPKISTDGGWRSLREEGILTYIRGSTRANVTFKVRDENSLLESERDIIQPATVPAFALTGNVVGYPSASGEIDPLLSALAGDVVTVAAIPAGAAPSLADLAATANDPASTDVGQFRTLRPDTRNYDLGGSLAARIAPWLTGNASLRFNRSDRESLRGLPSALFVLPLTNPASPFSRDVGLAFYGASPLETDSRHNGLDAGLRLNGLHGKWTSYFDARLSHTRDRTLTERRVSSAPILLGDAVDPFAGSLEDLILLRTDEARARTTTGSATLSATGPAVTLPAGEVQLTVEGAYFTRRLRSETTASGTDVERRFHRRQTRARAAIDAPLVGESSLGALSADAEGSINDYSDAGTLGDYAFGVTWTPRDALRLRASLEHTESPPAIQFLGNPVVVTTGVRTFDPLTGETVDVTQISGGNPDLDPERTRIWRLSGQATLVPRLKLQLNAELTDTDERDFLSFLPEASAAVMLAFPERFVRDSDNRLTTIDLRPVNFDSHRETRLRWGLSLATNLARGVRQPRRPSSMTRLALTANHSIVFVDRIRIRPTLDSVNLLEGGAIGLGGGRVRHQLDGTAALTSRGLGLRTAFNWRGRSSLESRVGGLSDTLRFSPTFTFDVRTFAELNRLLPKHQWARGFRISLNALNVTNDRQDVRNSAGETPLQYQQGYRDPIGRTLELELRKVF